MTRLPEYENPPVVEVAISLQFKALDRLRSSHYGLFWQRLRNVGFRHVEDHGELTPILEDFEAKPGSRVGIRLQAFDDAPPLPRVWFLTDGQSELIQVQRDRLIVNWRQGAGAEPYPRYARIIERFKFALGEFEAFIAAEQLGGIVPNQCEVTYVNQIPAETNWSKHGELSQVITVWRDQYSDSYLSVPEDVNFTARYRMEDETGKPLGRVHVAFQPAYQTSDRLPIFLMNLTARGAPASPDLNGAFELFDREHEWIVRSFTSITTERMHKAWKRRKNG